MPYFHRVGPQPNQKYYSLIAVVAVVKQEVDYIQLAPHVFPPRGNLNCKTGSRLYPIGSTCFSPAWEFKL